MNDCPTQPMHFETDCALALEAAFDGGMLTSDGGLPFLARMDSELGVSEALAACIPEWRTGAVRHSLVDLVRQRVLQIACGYEDQNDAALLRSDPLLKLACGRLPESSGEDLARASPRFRGWRKRPRSPRLLSRWPRRSSNSILVAAEGMATLLRGCFWTSTPPTTRRTEIRRG
jgi:hypothetical protein